MQAGATGSASAATEEETEAVLHGLRESNAGNEGEAALTAATQQAGGRRTCAEEEEEANTDDGSSEKYVLRNC